ncbi:MAG: hypothetical protein LBL96_00060 [Clostridiales bacterium]|jgi:hypothetical protein|nr:hypothetical protein [Clostridiales bacterium]
MYRGRLLKSVLLIAVSAVCVTAAVILFARNGNNGGTRAALSINETPGGNANGYYYDFVLDTQNRGNVNCYMVKYKPNDYEAAYNYALRFIDIAEYYEDDRAYIFYGSDGEVTIDKSINQIHYDNYSSAVNNEPISGDQAAIDIAQAFFRERMFQLFYEEAQVYRDDARYQILFVSRLSNLKNYAFANRLEMDMRGNIISADYFTVQSDKVGDCKTLSMAEAFDLLPPLSLDNEETVRLQNCQLVYIYDESIIQPAYYFQGLATEDRTFECYVKAAVF